MLGDALMVAPILREDGVSQYYLPKGTWTHLLSGTVKEGGSWNEETYDYFSMPLYVRENTLFALGAEDHRPDYNYQKGLSLRLYQLQDGCKAECFIPDINGNIVNRICASRCGNEITFTLEKTAETIRVEIYTGSQVLNAELPEGITEVKVTIE